MRSTMTTTTALFALVAAVAAWTAPGAYAANDCLQTCLVPYGTNTTASIKASCRDAWARSLRLHVPLLGLMPSLLLLLPAWDH